jgi:uncharacterized protein YjbJ (UPF0337 family)
VRGENGCGAGRDHVAQASNAEAADEEATMGSEDKLKNTAEGAKGKAKEAAGKLTDDERMEAEGKADQVSSDAKQAGEKVKDIFKD